MMVHMQSEKKLVLQIPKTIKMFRSQRIKHEAESTSAEQQHSDLLTYGTENEAKTHDDH